ncbi:hypothetical protein MIR68_010558 [Amoeboaphelidium protococcarum]|nr:hypothetical protein MIR68_010558 [Amoeboaphelidium protococcarum]
MISTLAWVGKGVANERAVKQELDDEEYQRICELTSMNLEDAKQQMEQSMNQIADEDGDDNMAQGDDTSMVSDGAEQSDSDISVRDTDDVEELFDMKNYDQEVTTVEDQLFNPMGQDLKVFRPDGEDPYIKLDDQMADSDEEEDLVIDQKEDNLILVGKTEDDISVLECYVYNAHSDSLYVHHDLMLPSFPLCIEPVNFAGIKSQVGQESALGVAGACRNYCAVGTFNSEVEIWDLNVIDAMYPQMILGGQQQQKQVAEQLSKSKKKNSNKSAKSKQSTKVSEQVSGHSDAVLSISWNRYAQNFLVTGSADGRIILWNLAGDENQAGGKVLNVYERVHGGDKVSCVRFKDGWYMKQAGGDNNNNQKHLSDASLLLTGGYDGRVCLLDVQKPVDSCLLCSYDLKSDVESISWDPFYPQRFVVGCDNGRIYVFDIDMKSGNGGYKFGAPSLTIDAHSSSITSVDFNQHIPGMILTSSAVSSADGALKIWDIGACIEDNNGDGAEVLYVSGKKKTAYLASRDTGAGKVLSASFCPDNPFMIAVGGSSGQLSLWNVSESKAVREHFHRRRLPSYLSRDDQIDVQVVNMNNEFSVTMSSGNEENDDKQEVSGLSSTQQQQQIESDDDEDDDGYDDEAELEETIMEMKGVVVGDRQKD